MASQPPPPESIILGAFDGVKNTVTAERLKSSELVTAVNVDIDDAGQLRRRRGFVERGAGDHHSLADIGGLVLVVRNGMLGTLRPSLFFTPLVTVGPEPLVYTNVGSTIYYASSTASGKIVNGSVLPWGAQISPGQWVSPVIRPTETLGQIRGKFLGAPPHATQLETYKGRIYLANGNMLWATELYLYDLVDKTKNFIQFEDDITMIAAAGDGMYIGTVAALYFLSGAFSSGLRLSTIIEAGVVPGSKTVVPYSKAVARSRDRATVPEGSGPLFMTTQGLLVGLDSGTVYNLTQNHIVFPAATGAAALYREDQGANSYVVVANSGGTPVANTRIGDYADAEIIREAQRG